MGLQAGQSRATDVPFSREQSSAAQRSVVHTTLDAEAETVSVYPIPLGNVNMAAGNNEGAFVAEEEARKRDRKLNTSI